ncbi:DNA-directed RNA polymerase III subunit RPC4 [Genypterus blacodes]|uniref:DNA-directed RNA polymerase III subunit RPC4 n=1 Tax=Genypterus blacodes TaxID=154954 RepID=UPI003F77363E
MANRGDGGESAASSPGFNIGAGLSFQAGRGLMGRNRGLSSPTSPGRLTSLRNRDLTLGGSLKKTKKTFEPNVHAVRKSKEELKEDVQVAPKKERREREERKRENRGKRREKPQTIQSHSIFEHGPANSNCKTVWRSAADMCDAAVASSECKSVKEDTKESEDDEEEILRKLQRDDFIDDPGLRNDAKLKPIQLPLCQSSCLMKADTVATTTCKESHPAQSRTELHKPEQRSLRQLFHDLSMAGGEELFFIQLPDCMPGKGTGQKPSTSSAPENTAKKDNKVEHKKSTHLQANETVVKEGCSVLSDFPEGVLGKLQIRKSGKMELKLGDIVMDVSEGAAFSFLQQLVSVHQSDGRTGDMMVLGNVSHKLVLSPNFQALLEQAPVQQKGGGHP